MPDVFVSYRSDDCELVAPVAEHLASLGLDVWFDQKIRVGEHWDAEIEEKLKSSKAVVVCWSRLSVQSPWVMWEATYAQQAGSIVPAFFDTSTAPGPLSRVQGAQLGDWQGEAGHAGWSKLVAEIGRLLSRPDLIAQVEARATEEKNLGHGRPISHFLEEKKTRKTHRILAINGAGLRAVICLAYLERLEELLSQRLKSTSFRLSHYFDLIGGTSVGSLIAAGLALGAKVTDLCEVFFEGVPNWSSRGKFWRNRLAWNEEAIQKSILEVCGTDTLGSERFQSGFAAIMKRMDSGRTWIVTNNPQSPYGFRTMQLKDVVGRPGTLAPVKIQVEAAREPYFFLDAALSGFADPSLALLAI